MILVVAIVTMMYLHHTDFFYANPLDMSLGSPCSTQPYYITEPMMGEIKEKLYQSFEGNLRDQRERGEHVYYAYCCFPRAPPKMLKQAVDEFIASLDASRWKVHVRHKKWMRLMPSSRPTQ